MIVLILGTAALAGVGMGWYGHKAGLRIGAWGHGLDEQDLIFQQMSEGEGETWSADSGRLKDAAIGATLGNSHYPAAAAALK